MTTETSSKAKDTESSKESGGKESGGKAKEEAKGRSSNGGGVQVGTAVLYQPRENEFPMPQHRPQQAAIVTAYDEDNEVATLAVFLAGTSFLVSRSGIKEGEEDGTFQQPGTQSITAQALEQAKEQAEELAEKEQKMAEEKDKEQKDKDKDKDKPGQPHQPNQPGQPPRTPPGR